MSDRPELTAVTGDRQPFDPETVPAYPLVRAVLRETPEGDLEGVVDDEIVATDVDLEPVRRAVVSAAAKVAAKRLGPVKAIRVRGTAPDGSVFHLVVSSTGEVFPVSAPGGPAGSSAVAAGSKKKRKDGPAPESGSRTAGCLFWAIVVVLPLMLVGLPIVLLVLRSLGGEEAAAPPKPPKPTQLPVIAPAPYEAVASWSQKLGLSSFASASGGVTTDSERVYVAQNAGNGIGAYDAVSGLPAWKFDDLDGTVSAGPALAVVDEEPVVVVASSTQLVLLDPDKGTKEGEWELPATASTVLMTSTGPVVLVDATHARIVVDGDLVTRVLPATGSPVAPTKGGALVVVGGAGQVWSVTSKELAGSPRPLPAVKGYAMDDVAGWTGDQMVLTYRPTEQVSTSTVRLLAVDTSTWRSQWVTGDLPPVYTMTENDFGLRAAPSGEWGIFGVTALDLATGKTTELVDDWATTAVGDRWAFGTGEGRPLVASRAGVTAESLAAPQLGSTTGVVAPQAVSGDRAYLVTNDAGGSVLFALSLPSTRPTSRTSPSGVPSTGTTLSGGTER